MKQNILEHISLVFPTHVVWVSCEWRTSTHVNDLIQVMFVLQRFILLRH